MDDRDDWEPRGCRGVRDRCHATAGIPAEDLRGELDAPERVETGGELDPRGCQVEDVGSAGCIQDIRPVEEAREGLAVCAVTDEAEALRGRDAGGADDMSAPASTRPWTNDPP